MNKNGYITSYGFFTTIVVTTVGIGIFSYPRMLAELVGNDGWFVVLLASIISYIMLVAILKIVKANGFNHFSSIMRERFGRVIGDFVMIVFAVYHLLGISLGMRAFVEVIKMHLLEKTPTEFLLALTILLGIYLIRGGLRSVVKFNEVAFGVMFIPMFIVLIFLFNITDFTNLLPVLRNEPVNYLKAVANSSFTFGGLSIAFLAAPLLKDKEDGGKVIRRSIMFIGFFYAVIVVLTIAVLSKEQARQMLWPTIAMIRSIDLPGAFVERWEGVVMALWIIFFFTTFTNGLYFSSYIAKEVFFLGDIKISSVVLAPAVYLVALYPENIVEVYYFSNQLIPAFTLVTLIIVPFILLVVSRKKTDNKKGAV
jgi:spore germination protein